jgi:hypothetical protein
MTPPRTIPPTMAPPRPPPLEGNVEVVVFDGYALVEFDGLRANGQKSPPLGGTTQVRESPSLILVKIGETDIDVVVLTSVMNGAGVGKESDIGQPGPREPMNE